MPKRNTLVSDPSQASTPAAPPKTVEVAIAVVFEAAPANAQLLICKRKADTVLGGYWEFPGGKCHPGESPAACAIREVEEETGLRVRTLAELPLIEHEYPHARVRLHPFVCTVLSGTLELRAVADARWIDPATVTIYEFPPANVSLLQAVRQGKPALLQQHHP